MMDEKNMDKIFRQKLESLSEEPAAPVWKGIQEKLAAVRSRKRRLNLYRWSAAAALLALALIAGWHFAERQGEVLPQVSETDVVLPPNDLLPPEKELAASPDQESSSETSAARTPAIIFPEPEIKTLAHEAPEDNGSPEGKNREYTRSVHADLTMMDRIEPAQVFLSGSGESADLRESQETGSSEELPAGKREYTETVASTPSHVNIQRRRWKMGLSLSPGYSSYSATHGATYASNMTYEASGGNGNLSGGLSVHYKAGRKWSVESGVFYAQDGQIINSSPQFLGGRMESDYASASPAGKLYFNTPVTMTGDRMAMNSTAGIIEFENIPGNAELTANPEATGAYSRSLLIQGELSQVFDFVEIPLYVRYLLIDSKIDLELVGGLNAGLVVGNNVYVTYEYGVQKIGETRDISTVNASGSFGFGLTYALSRHFSLAVEPRMNYYMNSINHNPEVQFRPYRVGIYTGLYYAF